jgi:excisionase family DNA binding protein
MDEPIDEWDALPIMLTIDEAARVLRIGRSKAYELAANYTSSGGTQGLPCLRLGDLLRVPKFALHEFVTTGRIVQLIPQPDANATHDGTGSRKPARKSSATDRAQLSLLGSD